MAVAGQIAKTEGINVVTLKVAASTNIAKGDYVSTNGSGFAKQAATTDSRDTGFFVAIEASDNSSGSAGDKTVRCAAPGTWVYGKLGGTIEVGELVKIASATTVTAHGKPADATTPTAAEVNSARDYFGKTVGRFYGKDAADVSSTPADGANNDIGLLHLGGGT